MKAPLSPNWRILEIFVLKKKAAAGFESTYTEWGLRSPNPKPPQQLPEGVYYQNGREIKTPNTQHPKNVDNLFDKKDQAPYEGAFCRLFLQ